MRTTPLRESDLVVSILTRDRGTLAAIAKGARNSKRRFPSGIDIFDCGIMELTSSRYREDLFLLEGLQKHSIWSSLRQNLTKMRLASSAMEISLNLSHEGDPEGGKLFAPVFLLLKHIEQVESSQVLYSCYCFFLTRSLKLAGYDPLHHSPAIPESSMLWLLHMQEAKRAFPPITEDILKNTLTVLLELSEHFLGKQLHTTTQLLQSCNFYHSNQN